MKSRILFIIFIMLSQLSLGCSRQNTAGREYPCYKMDAEPEIDGVLSAGEWDAVPECGGFTTPFIKEFGINYPALKPTYFKIGYTAGALYVGITAKEPWTKQYAEKHRWVDDVKKQDGIELFIAPERKEDYRHFIINVLGTKWSSTDASVDGWEAKSHIGPDQYSMEIRIPFRLFGTVPAAGNVWTGNVCRKILQIICGEDLYTSWSPVSNGLQEPERFGRFVFKDEVLSKEKVRNIEKILGSGSDVILLKAEQYKKTEEKNNQNLIGQYKRKVEAEKNGITGITQGPADLIEPPDMPEGEVWRYGLGFPFQLSPTEAGLFVNIRMEGSGNIDFEIGSDLIIFNDMNNISADRAIPLSRYEKGNDPVHGNIIVRKGPVIGGFVPYGAVLPDGTPHPHAGTGYGMCWGISHRADPAGKFNYLEFIERHAMMFQFSYDGKQFRVTGKKRIDGNMTVSGYTVLGKFITNAIPDGKDLIDVMTVRNEGIAISGVARWKYGDGGWCPVSFTPVMGDKNTWSEPSLVRDGNGDLLFSARSSDRAIPPIAFDMAVWHSADDGKTWKQVLYKKYIRARSPVSIDRAVDGTPFILANTPPLRRYREVLNLWPLREDRSGVECRMTARDAKTEFGPAPSGSWWRIDHPNSGVIRLADGKLHNIVSYRIVDNGEVEGSAHPAPQTGCYVEEIISAGREIPEWRFK